MVTSKVCSRCGEEKPLTDFYKASGSNHRHGRKNECKPCWKAMSASSYRRNRTRNLEKGRQWREANAERMQQTRDRWVEENPERVAANAKNAAERATQWRRDHPEEARAKDAAKHERSRERRNRQSREWRAANRAEVRRYVNERRARIVGVGYEHVDELVALERDDGVCGICGEDVDPSDFHLDHVIPLSKGGFHNYSNVQPAHPACNLSKHDRLPF